jgi:hypothetical protein
MSAFDWLKSRVLTCLGLVVVITAFMASVAYSLWQWVNK